jgi:hypothetical protein
MIKHIARAAADQLQGAFGKIPDASIRRTTDSVRKEVTVAGFTTAGIPASKLTAIFSSIPQTGKLKALI